jgi:pimeloyl-ACP methyl ester carboxylesterase
VGGATVIEAHGATLYCEESGQGRLVVFIHPRGLDLRLWHPQVEALEGRYRVVRFDQRGHGRSSRGAGTASTVDDLRQVLAALNASGAMLVGLQDGAALAMNLAVTDPPLVGGLVLVQPELAGWKPTARELLAQTREAVNLYRGAKGLPSARRTALATGDVGPLVDVILSRGAVLGPNSTEGASVRDMVEANVHVYLDPAFVGDSYDLSMPVYPRLKELEVPVIVVTDHSSGFATIAHAIQKQVNHARHVVLRAESILVNIECATRFNEELLRFLDEQQ